MGNFTLILKGLHITEFEWSPESFATRGLEQIITRIFEKYQYTAVLQAL